MRGALREPGEKFSEWLGGLQKNKPMTAQAALALLLRDIPAKPIPKSSAELGSGTSVISPD